jgi:hypothetical protein
MADKPALWSGDRCKQSSCVKIFFSILSQRFFAKLKVSVKQVNWPELPCLYAKLFATWTGHLTYSVSCF